MNFAVTPLLLALSLATVTASAQTETEVLKVCGNYKIVYSGESNSYLLGKRVNQSHFGILINNRTIQFDTIKTHSDGGSLSVVHKQAGPTLDILYSEGWGTSDLTIRTYAREIDVRTRPEPKVEKVSCQNP